MSRVGVVLSGCGVNDGSEIHEAVITMLELDKAGAEMVLMAPNIDQMHVVNHYTGRKWMNIESPYGIGTYRPGRHKGYGRSVFQ